MKDVDNFITDLKCRGFVEGTIKAYTAYVERFLSEVKKNHRRSQSRT